MTLVPVSVTPGRVFHIHPSGTTAEAIAANLGRGGHSEHLWRTGITGIHAPLIANHGESRVRQLRAQLC